MITIINVMMSRVIIIFGWSMLYALNCLLVSSSLTFNLCLSFYDYQYCHVMFKMIMIIIMIRDYDQCHIYCAWLMLSLNTTWFQNNTKNFNKKKKKLKVKKLNEYYYRKFMLNLCCIYVGFVIKTQHNSLCDLCQHC